MNEAERGPEIIYRGDLGIKFCNAGACGQETSWKTSTCARGEEITSRGR